MADSAAPPGTRRTIDEKALERLWQRQRAADAAPWLHGEAARRMGERLGVIRRRPERVLDWWAHQSGSAELLARAYPQARVVAVEPQPGAAPPWWSPKRWRGRETVAEAAVGAGSAQLVWANMMLHAVADPPALMRRWLQALEVDGFLMFSTLGPGTLESLRTIYRRAGWPPPLAPFVDMHDLGDMLVEAGFADPVMDQEQLTLTWPDGAALLAELRTLGANLDPARFAGLRTPRWRDRLLSALAATAGPEGRPALVFELVYGHAFKPPPRPRVGSETTVAVEDLRAMARAGRARRG